MDKIEHVDTCGFEYRHGYTITANTWGFELRDNCSIRINDCSIRPLLHCFHMFLCHLDGYLLKKHNKLYSAQMVLIDPPAHGL